MDLTSADLTQKVVAWAGAIARDAVRLPSRQAREAFLAARRRELMDGAVAAGATSRDAEILAEACIGAARQLLTELLAQRAGVPEGRA
jgi:hypothetical protein